MTSILKSSSAHREAWAEEPLDRLTPLMSALSLLFLLVVKIVRQRHQDD